MKKKLIVLIGFFYLLCLNLYSDEYTLLDRADSHGLKYAKVYLETPSGAGIYKDGANIYLKDNHKFKFKISKDEGFDLFWGFSYILQVQLSAVLDTPDGLRDSPWVYTIREFNNDVTECSLYQR